MSAIHPCPCESGKTYQDCCEPLHLGGKALHAEALMRSRYSAYVLKLEEYLLKTWHPDTRPNDLILDQEPAIKWLGLKITRSEETSNTEAIVAFTARYKVGGARAEKMHETSQFKRENDCWYYLNGIVD